MTAKRKNPSDDVSDLAITNTEIPAPAETPAVAAQPPTEPYAVVSGGDFDEVRLDATKFKNVSAKKSLSVHHIQRRLNELGYTDAYADKDGWYGDLTRSGMAAFQQAEGLPGDGLPNAETLQRLFKYDVNVRVVI